MSEAITKACETCAGIGRPMTFWNGVVDCVDCSGTGRVPDVEATLRAELDAARAERLTTKLKSAEEVVVQARQLGAYSWEDRLDDSRVSDDAKQDARELGIAVVYSLARALRRARARWKLRKLGRLMQRIVLRGERT